MRWLCLYHHVKGGASWWGERVVKADDAREAALKMEGEIESNASHADPGLRVRVYGPIPEELAWEGWVAIQTVTIPFEES